MVNFEPFSNIKLVFMLGVGVSTNTSIYECFTNIDKQWVLLFMQNAIGRGEACGDTWSAPLCCKVSC